MIIELRLILAMFVLFPAIVAIYKYKKVDKKFHPFMFMIWIEVITETLNYIYKKNHGNGGTFVINLNTYIVLNFFLFLYLSVLNSFLNRKKAVVIFIIAILICVANYIFIKPVNIFFYSLCYVSFVMLFIGIDILSNQMIEIKVALKNNFWFWFSSTTIIYNTQVLIIFNLYFFAMFNTSVGKSIGNIQTITNAVCQIFFGIAMLKMPEIKARKMIV